MRSIASISIVILILSTTCVSCDFLSFNSSGKSALTTGLKGQVLAGPQCPVVTPDDPCPDKPFNATFHVLDSEGTQVATFMTDNEGRFEVELAPGTYTIVPDEAAPLMDPSMQKKSVTVPSEGVEEVTLVFDTGIL